MGSYCNANNDYVEIEDLPLDEFLDEEWVNASVVDNIIAHHNITEDPSLSDDLNVGDIFELKAKLQQTVNEWSIKCLVTFKPV